MYFLTAGKASVNYLSKNLGHTNKQRTQAATFTFFVVISHFFAPQTGAHLALAVMYKEGLFAAVNSQRQLNAHYQHLIVFLSLVEAIF